MPYKKGEGKIAIALFVDGLDLKFVHLALKDKKIILHDVQTVQLMKRLEERTQSESMSGVEGLDIMDVGFDIGGGKAETSESENQSNSSVLLGLLSAYPVSAYQLVYSISEPSVYYQTFEDSFGLKGSKLKNKLVDELSAIRATKPTIDSVDYIQAAEGQILSVIREDGLSLIDLIESIRDFLGKRVPRVSFIETSDISLMNMVRGNYELGESEISIIVYIGTEFSRLIFMKGEKFFHFAPVISEGKLTPNIENTIYSRILLEQDSAGIMRIDRVFLAGESHKIELKQFLAPQFAESPIEYITTSALDTTEFTESPDATVSEYAIPISAAMRLLEPKNPHYYAVDLLPTSVREGQKTFKLAWHGYVLMVLIFASTLFFTSRYAVKNEEVKKAGSELKKRQEKLAENQRLQFLQDSLTSQNQQYISALAVYDSVVPNYNRWSKVFYHLTNSVEEVNSIWIKEMNSRPEGVIDMTGYSVYRPRIPRIANMFEKATLQSVEMENIRGKDVYKFSLLIKKIDSEK